MQPVMTDTLGFQAEIDSQQKQIAELEQIVAQKQDEISRIALEYESAAKDMQASIHYAERIQRAVIPQYAEFKALFPDCFIYFAPRDIVSGDFYYFKHVSHYAVMVAADCTGHGVPGAFLSMLGMSILDYLAKNVNKSMINAGQMLDNVRSLFKQSLHQTDDGNHDGIDMALLIIDSDSGEAHYAGAFRPLIVAHNGQLARFEPDRMPIGVHYKEAEHFTDNLLHLQKNDIIYMYSDGVTDQFGYAQNGEVKKYTSRQFMQLLTEVNMLSLANQKVEIEKEMERWITNSDGEKYEQTDDAVIVGIRV